MIWPREKTLNHKIDAQCPCSPTHEKMRKVKGMKANLVTQHPRIKAGPHV